jgi:catechol 2,3-dioxygenase
MTSEWPLGAVELKVLDLEREVGFYEWFGLTRFAGDATSATLMAGGKPLLRLKALTNGQPRSRHTAGLFHFAILLPSEEELGGLFRRS